LFDWCQLHLISKLLLLLLLLLFVVVADYDDYGDYDDYYDAAVPAASFDVLMDIDVSRRIRSQIRGHVLSLIVPHCGQ